MLEAEEEIIRLRNAYKKESYGDINNGFYIREKLITFSEQEILEGSIRVQLPESFTDMPSEYVKLKYPSEQRPPVIKSNEQGDINFTFNLLPVPVPKEHTPEFRDQMQQVIKRYQPVNVFYETGEILTASGKAYWFDYKSHGIDEQLYNLVYFISTESQVLHGVFNCPMKEAQIWKRIVMEVIKSIAFSESKEENHA